jgi:hypothetical protein
MHVGLHGFEHFWLKQHALQIEALKRILLHDLYHRAREILPDIA